MSAMFRALALAGAMVLGLAGAQAQQFPSGYIQGNAGASAAPPRAISATAWFDRWCSSSNSNIVARISGSWACTTTLPASVQGNITEVGTIITGTWTATVIGVAYGGSGLSTYTIGDLIYASGATTLSKLAGVATGNALLSGGVATAPSWGKVGLTTHISGTLAEGNGGTNQTTYAQGDLLYASAANTLGKLAKDTNATRYLSNTGTSNAPAWAQIALGTGVSGQLPVSNGGTGLASGTSGGVLCFTGTTTGASSALLTQYGVVIGGGAGACPSSTAAGTAAQLLIGQSGAPTWNTVSGDVTIDSTGVTAIGSNKVTNSQLAQVATATFKGRATASTGNVEDLSVTQATALLNVMVGDSGSGGTKGLVPAPGVGDAAAGKFLKADGTWDEPEASGGSGLTNDERRNILLDRIYLSKALAGYQRRINEFADGYKASDGINAGASSGYTLNTGSGFYANDTTPGARITGGTPTAPLGGTAANFNDDNTGTTTAAAVGDLAATGDINSRIFARLDLGSTQTISKIEVKNAGIAAGSAPNGFGLWHSTDGSNWTQAGASFNATTSPATTERTGSFSARYVVFALAQITWSTTVTIADLNAYGPDTPSNMNVVSTAQTAGATVSNGRVLIEYNPVDSITLNTDLTAEVTCDGTNWASATLSSAGTAQAGRLVAETADTSCGANTGTTFAARIKSFNNKSLQIYGKALTVH